jgi:hypothetical protein
LRLYSYSAFFFGLVEVERKETKKKEPKIPKELLMSLISGKGKYRLKNGSN